MLVQRQAPKRLRNLLIIGAAVITPVLGYIVYMNFFSSSPIAEVSTPVQQKTVPAEFGQSFFRDPRFNTLIPKEGTALIAQAPVIIPSDVLPAPMAVQAFDMQSGGTVFFTWKRPDGAAHATGIRLNRVSGQESTNVVTLPATTTSYQLRGARDGSQTAYELFYVTQNGIQDSGPVQARTGAASGMLSVAQAGDASVQLTWTNPAGEFDAIEVYRSELIGELGQRVARLDATTTSYTDAGGRAEVYFYVLRRVTSVIGGELWRGQVTSTDHEPPASPQSITASYVRDGATAETEKSIVRITWSPSTSPDVIGYDVYRSSNAMSLGGKIGSKDVKDIASIEAIASASEIASDCSKQHCFEDEAFTVDKLLPKGIPYYYSVIAIDRAGNHSSLQELGVSGRNNPFIPL